MIAVPRTQESVNAERARLETAGHTCIVELETMPTTLEWCKRPKCIGRARYDAARERAALKAADREREDQFPPMFYPPARVCTLCKHNLVRGKTHECPLDCIECGTIIKRGVVHECEPAPKDGFYGPVKTYRILLPEEAAPPRRAPPQ